MANTLKSKLNLLYDGATEIKKRKGYIVRINHKKGIIDLYGNMVVNPDYNEIIKVGDTSILKRYLYLIKETTDLFDTKTNKLVCKDILYIKAGIKKGTLVVKTDTLTHITDKNLNIISKYPYTSLVISKTKKNKFYIATTDVGNAICLDSDENILTKDVFSNISQNTDILVGIIGKKAYKINTTTFEKINLEDYFDVIYDETSKLYTGKNIANYRCAIKGKVTYIIEAENGIVPIHHTKQKETDISNLESRVKKIHIIKDNRT